MVRELAPKDFEAGMLGQQINIGNKVTFAFTPDFEIPLELGCDYLTSANSCVGSGVKRSAPATGHR
jgi:hypothetical protein